MSTDFIRSDRNYAFSHIKFLKGLSMAGRMTNESNEDKHRLI